jgi:hypothetical protein
VPIKPYPNIVASYSSLKFEGSLTLNLLEEPRLCCCRQLSKSFEEPTAHATRFSILDCRRNSVELICGLTVSPPTPRAGQRNPVFRCLHLSALEIVPSLR